MQTRAMDLATDDQYRLLLADAAAFKQAAPWDSLDNEDFFGFIDPISGQRCWCLVLGAGGREFGLNVCVGDDAFINLLDFVYDKAGDEPDRFMRLSMISVGYEDRGDCTKEELALLKKFEFKCRGSKAYPVFREYSPGFLPWLISPVQCVLLRTAMRQTIEVSRLAQRDRSVLSEDSYLVRVPPAPPLATWENTYHDLKESETGEFTVITVKDDLLLRRVKSTAKKTGAWAVGLYYVGMPIQEDKNVRPYYPMACLCMDEKDGMIHCFELIKDIDSEGWKAVDKLIHTMSERNLLPSCLRARNDETYCIFKDMAGKLGIPIKPAEGSVLRELNDAWREMTHMTLGE